MADCPAITKDLKKLVVVTQGILTSSTSTPQFKLWQPSEASKADRAELDVVRPEQPQPPGVHRASVMKRRMPMIVMTKQQLCSYERDQNIEGRTKDP